MSSTTDLGSGLYSWVKTVSAITAILGTGDSIQFYPTAVLEEKTPPVAFYEDDVDAAESIQDTQPTVQYSDVRFSFVGSDTVTPKQLAIVFWNALQGFSGAMGSVNVQAVLCKKKATPSYQWSAQQFAVDAEYRFSYSLS